jgi:3-oxoacyl-[acyl-carrier protein] reductase
MPSTTTPLDLTGCTALVTGGGVGIGAAIAEAFASAGARVAVTYRTHAPAEQTMARLRTRDGLAAKAIQVEATEESAVSDAVGAVAAEFGSIDILVNNVGGLVKRATLDQLDLAGWRQILSVNLDSLYLFTHHAAPHLPHGRGRVINVASLAGHTGGHPGAIAYATSKAAVFGFTRSLATEFGPKGITVNAIAPGFIEDTPFHDTFTSAESKARTIARIPMARAGAPGDVAGAALWLASEHAAYVSGAVIDVNGAQYFH